MALRPEDTSPAGYDMLSPGFLPGGKMALRPEEHSV